MLPEERIVYPGTRLSQKGEDRDPGYMILGPKTSVPAIPATIIRARATCFRKRRRPVRKRIERVRNRPVSIYLNLFY